MGRQTVKRKTKPRTPPMTQGGKQEEEGSKNRKTAQIFVKVDGSKAFPLDASPSDKASDLFKSDSEQRVLQQT